MTISKILIICWSFIWGMCLIFLAIVRLQNISAIMSLVDKPYQFAKFAIIWAPIYAFTVWAYRLFDYWVVYYNF